MELIFLLYLQDNQWCHQKYLQKAEAHFLTEWSLCNGIRGLFLREYLQLILKINLTIFNFQNQLISKLIMLLFKHLEKLEQQDTFLNLYKIIVLKIYTIYNKIITLQFKKDLQLYKNWYLLSQFLTSNSNLLYF